MRVRFGLAVLMLAAVLAAPARSWAGGEFGDIGAGAQMVVVAGDSGAQSGFGATVRARFLWILGLELSASHVADTESVYAPAIFRTGLLIHVVRTEAFVLYLSPGLAGDGFGDAFNPVGDSTWYRIGGGMEYRFMDGMAIGAELHWTMPSESVVERYVADHEEEVVAEYLRQNPTTTLPEDLTAADIQRMRDDVTVGDVIDILPLDRFEVALGLRYYF